MILNGEPLEEVDCFKYLGSQVAADGGWEKDVVHRMNDGYRAYGVLNSELSNRFLGINAKKCLCEGVIVPTALYGAEARGMRCAERRKVNVLEMKCLRSLVGVSRMDRVGNEVMRMTAGIIIIMIIIILLKQDYKMQLPNNKIQMAWLTSWLVVGNI